MHTDAILVVVALMGMMGWFHGEFKEVNQRLGNIDRRLTIIETVLVMKNIMPFDCPKAEKDKG